MILAGLFCLSHRSVCVRAREERKTDSLVLEHFRVRNVFALDRPGPPCFDEYFVSRCLCASSKQTELFQLSGLRCNDWRDRTNVSEWEIILPRGQTCWEGRLLVCTVEAAARTVEAEEEDHQLPPRLAAETCVVALKICERRLICRLVRAAWIGKLRATSERASDRGLPRQATIKRCGVISTLIVSVNFKRLSRCPGRIVWKWRQRSA